MRGNFSLPSAASLAPLLVDKIKFNIRHTLAIQAFEASTKRRNGYKHTRISLVIVVNGKARGDNI
jgi:hypothetical protein